MPNRHHIARKGCRTAGFTLIELMVTVAVIGVLAVVAVPAMTGLVNAYRLNGAAGELQTAVQLARSEAVRRNVPVTLCGSADGLTCSGATAWNRWIVRGRDPGTVNTVDILRDETPAGGLQVSGPAAGIVFRSSGRIDAQAAVTTCMPVSNPGDNRRAVTVMISGVSSISKSNGGGACP